MALILASSCSHPEQEQQIMTIENNELTAFDVQEAFEKNGFTWFTENLILCSGDTMQSNAMTIGWGGIGNYLGHDRPAVTVYVAPKKWYDGFDAGIHTIYVGEVLGAWKRH